MPTKLDEIVEELRGADRLEFIELLKEFANKLPPLPERFHRLRDSAHRVHECQAEVFLFAEVDEGRVALFADAPNDAPTVRAFVSLLKEGCDGATVREVLSIKDDVLAQSGLAGYVGMQRQYGLRGVLRMLRREVLQAAAASPDLGGSPAGLGPDSSGEGRSHE